MVEKIFGDPKYFQESQMKINSNKDVSFHTPSTSKIAKPASTHKQL